MANPHHERAKDARALRKKSKRLREVADDLGDKHAVKKIRRAYEAQADEIEQDQSHRTGTNGDIASDHDPTDPTAPRR